MRRHPAEAVVLVSSLPGSGSREGDVRRSACLSRCSRPASAPGRAAHGHGGRSYETCMLLIQINSLNKLLKYSSFSHRVNHFSCGGGAGPAAVCRAFVTCSRCRRSLCGAERRRNQGRSEREIGACRWDLAVVKMCPNLADCRYWAEGNLKANVQGISEVSGPSLQLSWEHAYNIAYSCGKANTRKLFNKLGGNLRAKTSKSFFFFFSWNAHRS